MAGVACALLFAVAGCDTGDAAPQPTVSVMKQLSDAGCLATMTPDTPIAPELGIAGQCPAAVEPIWLAADDSIELIVDYGEDVDFAASTHAPEPTIDVVIDGHLTDLPIGLSPEHRVGDRAFFIATFTAPATPSKDVRVSAGVNAGFSTEVPVVFSIVRPPVALDVVECSQEPCTLPAAVGFVHAQVTVPGLGRQLIALHQTIDGVATPDPVAPFMTEPAVMSTFGEASVPVPVAHAGAVWVLSAVLGGTPASLAVTLHAPPITTKLTCGTPCTVARGSMVGFTITAPAGIDDTHALVTTRFNGVPQVIAAPVELVTLGANVVGLITLVAPSTPGSWQVDASIAGYPAPSIVASVP